MIRSLTRKAAFELVRRDLALFMQEHEADLFQIFREEMQRLDDAIPEENVFIDIKMVPLGEAVLKACLRALQRFLSNDFASTTQVNIHAPMSKG
jgi:hypothetical protein